MHTNKIDGYNSSFSSTLIYNSSRFIYKVCKNLAYIHSFFRHYKRSKKQLRVFYEVRETTEEQVIPPFRELIFCFHEIPFATRLKNISV